MAIVTSMPGEGNVVNLYDIPDDLLQKHAVSGDKASQMFPEGKEGGAAGIPQSTDAMSATKLDNADSLGEVQAYGRICVCRQLYCNSWRCWWHYYYCYC